MPEVPKTEIELLNEKVDALSRTVDTFTERVFATVGISHHSEAQSSEAIKALPEMIMAIKQLQTQLLIGTTPVDLAKTLQNVVEASIEPEDLELQRQLLQALQVHRQVEQGGTGNSYTGEL
ncbi:hypothetical protein H6F86_20825 [Phormidium sp. FACHB-592]|uniref:Mediator of RNA polymerase II transcription subunit 21 n=1 Tax=Stenomitos frigidus AS-A4 TaxID=2933935 RepID=A0ABV0KEL8_9CYAN|nr:hypothetical protein [Phormidium sp. FACHB-592]MBD2076278.1 hypothetical protein [Phormidium sp. FACHB-592]